MVHNFVMLALSIVFCLQFNYYSVECKNDTISYIANAAQSTYEGFVSIAEIFQDVHNIPQLSDIIPTANIHKLSKNQFLHHPQSENQLKIEDKAEIQPNKHSSTSKTNARQKAMHKQSVMDPIHRRLQSEINPIICNDSDSIYHGYESHSTFNFVPYEG